MKLSIKHTYRAKVLAGTLALLLGAAGCNPTTIDPISDPNNAALPDVLNNPSQAQINALGVGVEASLRLGHTNNGANNQLLGSFSREVVVLASNEPRWYGEILGTRGALNNNSFYSAGSYNAFARVIRAAQTFKQSARSTATATLSDAQKQGIYGFCDTYEALAKIHLLDLMGENGIRLDVTDPLNPSKFTAGSVPALIGIQQLLTQAATELTQAGSATFGFSLSSGYSGFDTPATFLKFNRALAARVALYQGDYAGALTAVNASFYNPTGDLTIGPKITFNPSVSGDQGNPYYQVPGSTGSTVVVVPDNFVAEADTLVLRRKRSPFTRDSVVRDYRARTKVLPRATRSLGGISGSYDPNVYPSQTAPIDIIRNEELILIAAEAKANTGRLTEAVADINVIRQKSGGLRAYAGPVSKDDLVNQVLRQRRYSLFYEGQWIVDLRRLNRVSTTGYASFPIVVPAQGSEPAISIPYSTGKFIVFSQIAKPFAEQSWDDTHL
jgi:hypothetical protein